MLGDAVAGFLRRLVGGLFGRLGGGVQVTAQDLHRVRAAGLGRSLGAGGERAQCGGAALVGERLRGQPALDGDRQAAMPR
ncbi:hypothetical protein [Streptomyces sp. YGL11-2]|uniref:hypothetical protein n=1 Tax=Streptomyces sp. YGL11-2 TaxID=3414028 RepID=UPI003CEE2EC7